MIAVRRVVVPSQVADLLHVVANALIECGVSVGVLAGNAGGRQPMVTGSSLMPLMKFERSRRAGPVWR
ncbi:hypothetical protein, partial [Nonomuraea longispora]|uniref:hypothetical protein n=1 Tax=Nonomuraea longispora TaxID=1848320 RepID=UPI001C70568B